MSSGSAEANCIVGPEDPIAKLLYVVDRTIVKIITTGPNSCRQVGTGFFVSPNGAILTANHVVPEDCSDYIGVTWITQSTGRTDNIFREAHVVSRSPTDVALLRLVEPPSEPMQFLQIEEFEEDHTAYWQRCTIVASHFEGQDDAEVSLAPIASVAPSDDLYWILRGDGFNPTRSGSPVILGSGRVIGILQSRSESDDANDRDRIIYDRAKILPFFKLPQNHIDVTKFAEEEGNMLPFFSSAPLPISEQLKLSTNFGISITRLPNGEGDPVVLKQGKVIFRGSTESVVLMALLNDGKIAREVFEERIFKAQPGHRFLPDTLELKVASHNPPDAPLPSIPCQGSEPACYTLSEDGSELKLRMTFYPGLLDGRRSWLDMEVRVEQVPNPETARTLSLPLP